MLVNEGLLDFQAAELTYLNNLQWGLFTANYDIIDSTVLADVVASEAAWAGYARQTTSPWTTPAIVSGGAQTTGPALLSFTNTSGASQTFWGWFVANPTTGKLVAALNIGAQTIPNTGLYAFAGALNEQNTGP